MLSVSAGVFIADEVISAPLLEGPKFTSPWLGFQSGASSCESRYSFSEGISAGTHVLLISLS